MSVLAFAGIERAFRKGVPVLDGVSFQMEPGEVVGLLGRNGAGKTTLMKVALGMIHPHAGQVRVLDMDPWRQPIEIKRRLGYVAEDQILPPHFRVRTVLDFHRQLFPTWDSAFEQNLTGRFRLDLTAKVKELSKGQARQLALVCAVAHRPELLLLDEPAGGLDPSARREFLETAIQLLSETGTAILFSSHHMQDVERVAGRVVLLDEGKVLIDSDLDQLREEHCLAVVPRTSGVEAHSLLGLAGCLRVRRRPGALHAVFRGQPEEARLAIERQLQVSEAVSSRLPLEELFVELVGGDS